MLLQNFTSRAVLDAVGSVMTNKYSEGYPYKRYAVVLQMLAVIGSLREAPRRRLFL